MSSLPLFALVPFALFGCWDAWCRYLKHKEHLTGMRRSEETEILQCLRQLTEMLTQTSEDIGSFTEKQRTILKTFLDSITDMVKMGEEDKQHLLNKMTASKLGKK